MSAPRIRRAAAADRDEIMAFWDRHWVPGHLLSQDTALFDWQYRDGDGLNMILAENADGLLGFLGYVPDTRFDPGADPGRQRMMLAGWRMRGGAPPGLGTALLARLRRSVPHAALCALGLSPVAETIYARLGFQTGALHHTVLPNAELERFRLLGTPPGWRPPAALGSARQLRRLAGSELERWLGAVADERKTGAFLSGRYEAHPSYRYAIFGVEEAGRPLGAVVLRKALAGPEADAPAALRLVDMAGPDTLLDGTSDAFQRLLAANGAEYVDLLVAGIAPATLEAAGFLDAAAHGLAVPNHFEPFSPEPRPIRFAMSAPSGATLRLLRGDGDQDRPNRAMPKGASDALEVRDPMGAPADSTTITAEALR